ncbi:rifin [Plasmodium reichenowi]|uniref:Rifin n=1 Tax=Plasmodium reichenowi TaxID=5854 RepID=A0A060RQP8_PLARE|nr:rifin [Plasmodium reichenowi]
MKIHYINILLFAFPLNILMHNQRNHNKTILVTLKTKPTKTHRTLCECELYAPSNYENDPEMKEVIDNFNKQTQQRFEEYDNRMKTTRQKCKDKWDKEIQKIILKDKMEKELTEKFSILETKIDTNDIPTCICKKSLADKMEKGCLRCGGILGSAMPELGAIGGTALYALNQLKPAALFAATKYAMAQGLAKGVTEGNAHGMYIVNTFLKAYSVHELCPDLFQSIGNTITYYDVPKIAGTIIGKYQANCGFNISSATQAICTDIGTKFKLFSNNTGEFFTTKIGITNKVTEFVEKATMSASEKASQVISKTSSNIITKQTALIESGFNNSITSIYAPIIAIVVIVLILVIIYLILRYRRKKRMKKKVQYIKLLEE